jgi:endonuclease III
VIPAADTAPALPDAAAIAVVLVSVTLSAQPRDTLTERHGGEVPEDRLALMALPGSAARAPT